MPTAPNKDSGPPLRPIAASAFGVDQARHLLWRAGFGGTMEQVRTLASWGPEKAVDHLLNVEAIHYTPSAGPASLEFDATIMLPASPKERQELDQALMRRDEDTVAKFRARRQEAQAADRQQIQKMQRWWLARMIETPKPLEEKMTLFWHGHFATGYRTIENSYHMYVQNQLFRANAVGSYSTLLFAIIRDPAMLAYLDNNRSREEAPNENLAREIMELFSLGVGGYTERDIKEGARALTGYTFEGNEFVFRREWHAGGSKTILGKNGNLDGDGFVTAILEQKRCSEFIAAKLYRFFAADLPTDPKEMKGESASVAQAMASELRAARYEVKPALRKLFLSQHFYSPAVMGAQIKSPVQLIVGAARSLGTPVRDLGILTDAMVLMGQEIYFPPSVAGWSGSRSWINTSTLYVRQNIMTFLLAGKTPGGYHALSATEQYDPMPLLNGLSADDVRDPEQLCEHLLRTVLGPAPGGAPWTGSDRLKTLVEFTSKQDAPTSRESLIGTLSIITAMPEHQLC